MTSSHSRSMIPTRTSSPGRKRERAQVMLATSTNTPPPPKPACPNFTCSSKVGVSEVMDNDDRDACCDGNGAAQTPPQPPLQPFDISICHITRTGSTAAASLRLRHKPQWLLQYESPEPLQAR